MKENTKKITLDELLSGNYSPSKSYCRVTTTGKLRPRSCVRELLLKGKILMLTTGDELRSGNYAPSKNYRKIITVGKLRQESYVEKLPLKDGK